MFRIVQTAPMAPGKCVVSGSTHGPFLDTGQSYSVLGGRVYLNIGTLKELARAVGMVEAARGDEIRQEMTVLKERAAKAETERDRARAALDALEVVRSYKEAG